MKTPLMERPKVSEADRVEWIKAVGLLLTTVEDWSHERGWKTERFEVSVDEGGASYIMDALSIFADEARIHLEPIGQRVFGAAGRVDLMVWPALYRVALLYKARHNPGETWTAQLDSGVDWPDGWTQESFYKLTEILARRA